MGLVPEYQVQNPPIRAAFKMLTALPFVPENLITSTWRQLYRKTWQLLSIITRGLGLVQHTLIRSFPIAEGWRHGFNAMMSCSNPSIWKFLQSLKNEQNITDVKMTKLMVRESPEPRSAKWRKYNEKLQTIIQKFDSCPTILDFLKCTSCLM